MNGWKEEKMREGRKEGDDISINHIAEIKRLLILYICENIGLKLLRFFLNFI